MKRFLISGLVLIGLSSWLISCTQAGYFLEWPGPAQPPSSDWADRWPTLSREYIAPPDLPDWSVSYVRGGDPDGRRVIFVHGSPGQSSDWRQQLADIDPRYNFVSVDRPGFGFSTPRKALESLPGQAQALAPLMDTDDGRRVILVGWSLGGPIIARAAVDYPDRVAGLVIVAGSLDPDLEKVRFVQRVAHATPVRYFLKDGWRIANDELIPYRRQLKDMAPRLADVTVPVFILHGTADTLVPYGNALFMRKAFSGSSLVELETFEGAGHAIVWQQSDRVLAAIYRIDALELAREEAEK